MPIKSVYYSLPVNYPGRAMILDTLNKDLYAVKGGVSVSWWEQGQYYDPTYLDKADAFVFAMSDNKFNFSLLQLPSGVLKEFKRAFALGKPIYYLYKTVGSKIPNYYKIVVNKNDTLVSGLAGSSAQFYSDILNESFVVDKLPQAVINYDLVQAKIEEEVGYHFEEARSKKCIVVRGYLIDKNIYLY